MEENLEITDSDSDEKYNVSVKGLGKKTKEIISALLNPPKVLATDEGLPRDWQGLAELVGIPGERMTQLLGEQDPTVKVLTLWHEEDPEGSTINKLFSHLERIDRFDIIDDIKELVDHDISQYKNNGRMEVYTDLKPSPVTSEHEMDILTRDDFENIQRGLPLPHYDAFVLFADEDMDFATKVIDTMEKDYNFKFCTKHRDLIFGTFELDAIIKLIEERCRRLIVIFSDFFFKSKYLMYFTSFAQSVGIDQSIRKIIPCLYSPCDIPFKWKIYFMLDYKRYERSGEALFWEKLRDSVKTPTHKPVINHSVVRSQSIAVTNNEANASKVKEEDQPVVATTQEANTTLKVKKEGVKFNSMIDINGDSENIVPDSSLISSTSSNSLITINTEMKKSKKTNWLKKILTSSDNKIKSASVNGTKEKKHFFSRHIKRKVAVAN